MLFRERQQIAICVAAVVMTGAFVLLRYLPLQKKVKAVEQARAVQTVAIAKASRQSEQLPALKEQLLKLQTTVCSDEVNIPAQRALGVFLHRIANLMNEHNLTKQLVQPGKEIKAGQLNCIPVTMQCKGGLKQIFEFFKSLQKLDRLVRIEQVKLVNDADFSGQVSIQTKAVIYYRQEAGEG
jgi:Tfp pilus assembly protein PilO